MFVNLHQKLRIHGSSYRSFAERYPNLGYTTLVPLFSWRRKKATIIKSVEHLRIKVSVVELHTADVALQRGRQVNCQYYLARTGALRFVIMNSHDLLRQNASLIGMQRIVCTLSTAVWCPENRWYMPEPFGLNR